MWIKKKKKGYFLNTVVNYANVKEPKFEWQNQHVRRLDTVANFDQKPNYEDTKEKEPISHAKFCIWWEIYVVNPQINS